MAESKRDDLWYASFRNANYRKQAAIRHARSAQVQVDNSIAPIVSVEHFSAMVGLDSHLIQHMIGDTEHFYREFSIPKRSGGRRVISAPVGSLLQCQRWILKHVLSGFQPADSVHGFVVGRSIFTNAKVHVGQNALLKVDIQDFFPSISLARVVAQFIALGYAGRVARCLGLLCTLHAALPQGAATSPALANLACSVLDNRLTALAQANKLAYSRYADDLVFSGDHVSTAFSKLVEQVLAESGFSVNHGKTRMIRGAKHRKIVTGLLVSGDKIRLPKSLRRRWRSEIHRISKGGVLRAEMLRDPLCVDRAIGKAQFWLQAEPDAPYPARQLGLLKEIKRAVLI